MTQREINERRKAEGLPPLNFKLFRAVIEKLETAPLAYEQANVIESDSKAPCGTAGCIGGWAYLLAGNVVNVSKSTVLDRAAGLLGLNQDDDCWEDGDAVTVFSANPEHSWPEPFASQWRRAAGREQEAKVAVAYLRNILTTGDVDAEGQL